MQSYIPLSFTLLSDREMQFTDVQGYSFAAFSSIITPMLAAAAGAFVYKGTAKPCAGAFGHITPAAIDLSALPFLVKGKGKFSLDLQQNCVNGYEFFWNARGNQRGSIVIILPDVFDFAPLLPHCFDCGYNSTPNMGNSAGGVKMCRELRAVCGVAVLFTASNGIEYMDVYASDAKTEALEQQADRLCGSNLARQIRLEREKDENAAFFR